MNKRIFIAGLAFVALSASGFVVFPMIGAPEWSSFGILIGYFLSILILGRGKNPRAAEGFSFATFALFAALILGRIFQGEKDILSYILFALFMYFAISHYKSFIALGTGKESSENHS